MFTTFIGLIDIQSWWEVPCIAHFCSLFSTTFELPVFDIEDLEEALLTDTDAEGQVEPKVYIARLLPDLIVALLKGCDTLAPIVAHISPSNYQMFLRRLFRQKCQEHRVENPFNTDTDFEKLPLRTKILILKYLCEFRLDSDDVASFSLYEPDSIRLEPLGYDRNGSSYWHFFGTRLYREDYVHGKHKSGSTKPTVWQVICFSEEDWRNLAHKFENSTDRKERALHALLVENFLPYIPKLFRDKERVRRVKLLERKTSSRLRLKREERILRQQQQVQQTKRESEQPGPSEVPEEENPSRGQQLAEARAKRAERRSRSNSVTSIVTTHASSSEPPLTPDFIFQPKENAFRKELSTYPYLHTTNLRGSTSPSVGSLLLKQGEEEEDHLQDTISGSGSGPARETNRSPSCVSRESVDSASSYRNSTGSSSTFVSGESTVHVQSLSDSFFIAKRHDTDDDSESLDNVEAENNINTNNTIDHWRTAAESLLEIKSPNADKPQPIDSNKKHQNQGRRVCSTELESLLRSNHNMAPTATKLPGRQTNNSLSSVTGPVILPFADGGMQKGSSAGSSNHNNNNGSTPGNGKSGIESATNNGGRKGKKGAKSAQPLVSLAVPTICSFTKTTSSAFISSSLSFTETDEVLQIGMHKVLESIKNHDDAWPFMDPVDEDIAPRYYSIIRRPMDLQKMEEKLDNGEYAMFGDFQYDFKLIVNNCRLYNGQANEYTEMVNNLQLAFERARKKYFDENSSDEEMMTLEHPDVSRSSAVKEKVSSSVPNKSGDTSSGGGKPSTKETGSNAAGSGTKADNTVKEKTKKSGSAVNVKGGSSASGSATDVDRGPLNSGESKKQTTTDKAKDNKPKPVKGAVPTASSDQKDGKHGAATKKQKPIKHPEMAADPKPAPEPLENEKSGSSGNKNLKRKRKEREKANNKVKSRKVKTETGDDRGGDVVMKEEVDVRAVENKEDDDWGGPERKRAKKERTEHVTKKVQSKSVSAADERHEVVYQDHKDYLVPVRSEQSKIEGEKRSAKDDEQEDYPVYESKKKAAIKALQRQEKEKKKYSAKVKKEEKKTKTTVSSNSLSGTGKYGKGKHEIRSPVRRSLSRSLSPAPLPKISRISVESPTATNSNSPPSVSRLGKDSTNDKSKAHRLVTKKTNNRNDTEYEETQKRDESKPKKSVAQARSGPAGSKGQQKKDTRNKRKEGVAKPVKTFENEVVVDDNKIPESNSDSSGTNADDGSDCEQDKFSRQRQSTGANAEELNEDGDREECGRGKKSDKSKNKKSKNNKNSVENNNDVEDHHHHRGSKKGRGSKVKGKEKKIDKKSHKKDKAGRGKKKSKPTSSYWRNPVSSGGEDDDKQDDVKTTDGSSCRRQQAVAEEHSKSASNCAKQTRDFTHYSIHSHDGLSRSASRSPSPIGSYFSDQSEDNDDEMDDGCSKIPKGLLDRPITPDIKDKFDLIKERRNRAAAAAAVAAAAKAKAKQTKVKTKAKETATGTSPGKKGKQKTQNRGQQEQQLDVAVAVSITASASGSKHPKKRHQQQHQQDQENEKPAVEMAKQKSSPIGSAKGKKKRDKSIEQSAYGTLDTSSSWNKAHEKKRPTDSKKVDRSIEYEFVDEAAYDPVSPSIVPGKPDPDRRTSHASAGVKAKAAHKRPLAAGAVSVSQKHAKPNAKPTAAMITKTSGGVSSASKGAMVPAAAAGGANMEELELETEQTLKDINKWLENTPRFPEYSSASNSPSRYIMDDFDSVPVKIEDTDFRKPIPLSQLPASSGPSAAVSPLRGSSPALAAMAAPPTAFSPKSSTTGASAKPIGERAGLSASQHSSGAIETSLKDTTNSGKDSTTTNMKSVGSANHTILGPPPIIPAHSQKKEVKEPKRKTLKEKLSQLGGRKRDLHRTIDRLQPGKTKGNLIGTMQNLNKPDDLFAIGGGSGGNGAAGGGGGANGSAGSGNSGALGKFKEVKNSLIVKTDESKPKLSLGTVLNTEGFGIVQQHNFADDVKDDVEAEDFETRRSERKPEEENTTVDEPATKSSPMFLSKLSNGSANSDVGIQKTTSTTGKTEDGNNASSTPGDKEQAAKLCSADEGSFTKEKAAKKENGATKPTAATLPAEGKDGVSKGADKPSATPNLSAWFKAFGVPKKPKKSEDSDEPGKASPASEKSKGNEQTPPTSESSLAPSVPGGLEGSNYTSLSAPPRQRKASTGSTVSERSSYSQDPDSPRIGIDERIGGYPGPYPSPIGASPIMTSPKLDESQKSPYHPMNGAIKVGFYQDTTQKSSPEKSCSPRDMPSSYPQYSQHLYTSNTASGNATNSGSLYGSYGYGGISSGTPGPSTSSAITGSTSTTLEEATRRQNNNNSVSGAATDSFKGYGKELKSPVDFYDQYKQPASQESDYNSSMSPSTNPNSPYHNPASSPYHQQPNSPSCYQQQSNQASSPYNQQQQHQQSLASPASSGPLSPYSTSSVTPNPPTVPHSPTSQAGLGGHSPYNNSSQAHSPYHGGANNNQAPPPQSTSSGTVAGGPKSKPNTPLHQSPNSPFSQSNQSSPYSQQDPNSPYSQGQLSPFQPMSPKPSQPTVATSASGGQSSIKLAPPIITPQQAAAAAGVILPVEAVAQNLATPASGGSTASSSQHQATSTPPQINPHHQHHNHQSASSSSHWSHQGHYNPYLPTGSGDPGSSGSSSAMLMPPAPAHMPNATSSQAQQPQQAHHNAHQHPSPAHAHQQHHDQQQQSHPHTQQHQHPPLQNHHQRQPHHALAAAGQQQHSHLSNLLMGGNSNPYASTYGRPYDLNSASAAPANLEHQHHHSAHHHQQQHHHPQHQHQQHQQHSSKVPEMINLGYSEPEATGNNSNQDVPMNMETTGGALTLSGKNKHPGGTDGKESASKQPLPQQHPQQSYDTPLIDYAGAMDASISKSKSFDVFNRSAPMNYPRGFGSNHAAAPPINSGAGGGVGSSPVGYDHHGNNINKAHEQHGAPSYNMQSSSTTGTTTAPSALASAKGASGGQPSELMLSRYDQRSPQQIQLHPQQQQQSANNMDLSSSGANSAGSSGSSTTGYKPYSSAISGPAANLMDPSIRNLTSLSSLYNPDDRLLGAPGAGALPTATAGYYDKSIPPTAHMYPKNLAPTGSSSAAVAAATATTSTLQQMFNSTMAATSSMAYSRSGEQQNTAYVPPGYHHQSQQQPPQQQQTMNTPGIPSQKMIHGSGVPSSDCNPNSDPQPSVVPPPAKPKRTRKKKDPSQDLLAQQQQHQPSLHQQQPNQLHGHQQQTAHQGFQSYSGLKPGANPVSVASPAIGNMVGGTSGTGMGGSHPTGSAEASAISLKTTNVPGSAFNFGTGPSGLGLPGSLYGDTSVASAAYLDDAYRNTQNPYYLPPPSHRGPPVDDKLASVVNAAGTSQGVPAPRTVAEAAAAAAASAAASVVHPPPPSAGSPYHQFLASHHGSRPYQFMNQLDPIHQQYLQRQQDELRAQMMLNQGLLGPPGPAPPSAYGQASYHPALGMHKPYDAMNSMNRPPFL
ncbi:uncharacterized protein LOC131215423 [Anopheles bellator]|uniref:uncharacterized protein LOC131215423 n=1 Tax=Anopheles bellator TaxID=139047 RepID=UPI0026471D85|nr:uncharacterized protein LOC131215423 [Anopheles bellator]